MITKRRRFRQYLDVMCELRWVPSNQDVLRASSKTPRASTPNPGPLNLQMMDLSGIWQQRLIHCFENSPYMLFLVALSEYDQYHIQHPQVVRLTFSPERLFLTRPELST